MTLLAIDTATDRASVAVGMPGQLLAERTVVGARRHAAELLPAVQACLEAAERSLPDLTGIVLADGPGSFTGLRVGAAVVKALVRARPVAVWTAPSLLACAAGAGAATGEVIVPVSDALRGDLFVAAYTFEPGRIVTLQDPAVRRLPDIAAAVPRSARFCGPAASKLGAEPTWPTAGNLLRMMGLEGGPQPVADLAGWEPEYGRPAEAQAKWEREHGRPLDRPPGPPG